MLHEIPHCFGAGYLGEDSKADTDMGEDHPNCIMAYGRNEDDLIDFWEEKTYNLLFCSSCKAEMKTYIMMNY